MMMAVNKGDIVGSKGRIRTYQDERVRYISFDEAIVLEVLTDGISVNPIGKEAVLFCQPEDLLEQGEISAEGYARTGEGAEWLTGEQEQGQESNDEPEGSVELSGQAEPGEATSAPVAPDPADEAMQESKRVTPRKAAGKPVTKPKADTGIAAARKRRRRE
jgi:hypothetical protein